MNLNFESQTRTGYETSTSNPKHEQVMNRVGIQDEKVAFLFPDTSLVLPTLAADFLIYIYIYIYIYMSVNI